MQSRIITHFGELQELADGWDRLWASSPRRQIFNRFDWCRAWWQGYGPGVALYTPVAFANGRLAGILPLVLHNNQLTFLGDPGSDYNDILCEDSANPEILRVLLETLCNKSPDRWKCATLTNVPEQSLFLSFVAQLPGDWRSCFVTNEGQACSSVMLNDENRELTLRSILGQKEPRQHEKKLQKLGKLNFRHIEDRGEIRRHLPTFFEQHTQRWALVPGGNQRFLSERSRSFYEALVEQLDPGRELRFSVLELNGRPIACHFGFQLDGRFIHYKPTFDINLWEHSPGQVLTRSLFSYAEASGIKEFDFTIGNEAYKGLMANRSNRNFAIRFFRPRLMSTVSRKVFSIRQRMAKEQPPGYVLVKAVSARLVSLHESMHRDGFKKLLGNTVAKTFGVFHPAGNDLLLFHLGYRQEEPSRLKIAPGPPIHVATLGDLANHSVEQPEILSPAKLQGARARLKKGDLVYLARVEGKLGGLAWVGIRDGITPAEAGVDRNIPFAKPAAVIHELWVAPNLRESILPNLLRALLLLAYEKGVDVWIFCEHKDLSLRQSLEAAGFSVCYRVSQSDRASRKRTRTESVSATAHERDRKSVRSDLGLIES